MRGDRLKELREKRGWTQDDVAAKVGTSRVNVSHFENDKNKNMPSDTLVKYAELFGVTTDYILGISDQPGRFGEEFMNRLEMSDSDRVEDVLILDGRELTPEEARIAVAFLRTNRQMKNGK